MFDKCKVGVTSEGIFNLVPSSKKCTLDNFLLLVEKYKTLIWLIFLEIGTKFKMPSEISVVISDYHIFTK